MTNDFPTDEVEFGRYWSSVAGQLSATKEAACELERRSGMAFVARQDAVAGALRDAAAELNRRADELSKCVETYIKEDRRRRYEIRKAIG